MKVCIIYDKFYEYDGSRVTLGGIQSYIASLSSVISNSDMEVVIYQRATVSFKVYHKNTKVIGVCQSKGQLVDFHYLVRIAKKNESLSPSDLVIWATEDISCDIDFCNTLAIQHGISFDIHRPNARLPFFLKKYLRIDITPLYQLLRYYKAIREIKKSKTIVCVDYNYPNWLRTIQPNKSIDSYVIPNFTKITPIGIINEKINSWDNNDKIFKILFARRFFDIRGLSLMIDLSERLINEYGDRVDITFAGEGPRLCEVINLSNKYRNITITSYSPDMSLHFHQQFDIALVPSIGSEGTSLSLLEAMSAGCYCLSSQVGGLTNIILDRFNGRILRPKVDDWFQALTELIESHDRTDIKKQIYNAHNIVSVSFSYERWELMWKNVLHKIENNEA